MVITNQTTVRTELMLMESQCGFTSSLVERQENTRPVVCLNFHLKQANRNALSNLQTSS